jgi:hypothetical protein
LRFVRIFPPAVLSGRVCHSSQKGAIFAGYVPSPAGPGGVEVQIGLLELERACFLACQPYLRKTVIT